MIRIPHYFKDFQQFKDMNKYELEFTEEYVKIMDRNIYYDDEGQDIETALSMKYASAIKYKYK